MAWLLFYMRSSNCANSGATVNICIGRAQACAFCCIGICSNSIGLVPCVALLTSLAFCGQETATRTSRFDHNLPQVINLTSVRCHVINAASPSISLVSLGLVRALSVVRLSFVAAAAATHGVTTLSHHTNTLSF